MKSPIRKIGSGSKLQELIVVCLILGIVFFVLFAVYKNMDNLSNIRRIDSIRSPYVHRENFMHNMNPNNLKSKNMSYEGFANPNKKSTDYSTYPKNEVIDTQISTAIDRSTVPKCGKVWGFNGVFCQPEVSDNLIDTYYSAQSDMSCEGSGLTKGQGNLCLDKLQKQLLTTRGGNSVYDSVIG